MRNFLLPKSHFLFLFFGCARIKSCVLLVAALRPGSRPLFQAPKAAPEPEAGEQDEGPSKEKTWGRTCKEAG